MAAHRITKTLRVSLSATGWGSEIAPSLPSSILIQHLDAVLYKIHLEQMDVMAGIGVVGMNELAGLLVFVWEQTSLRRAFPYKTQHTTIKPNQSFYKIFMNKLLSTS